jgi:hypothetical protein
MKKNEIVTYYLLFFLMFSSSCFSQEENKLPVPSSQKNNTFKIKVKDTNGKSIESVSIVYLKHNLGNYTNSNGEAILPLINDSLKVSCIGFRDTIFMLNISKENEKLIVLQNQIQQLQTVNVFSNSAFKNEVLLGLDESTNNFFKPGYGNQIAIKIYNSKIGLLKSIKLNHLKTQYISDIKIEIKSDENGFPSNNSLLTDTLVSTKKGKRFTEIEFLDNNIILEKGYFYIVVTHLGLKNFSDGDYIKYKGQPIEPFFLLTDQEKNENTYLNYLNRKWRLYPKLMNENNGKEVSNVVFSCKILYP